MEKLVGNNPEDVFCENEIRCHLCHNPIVSGETCGMIIRHGKIVKYRHVWDCLKLNHRVVELHPQFDPIPHLIEGMELNG